MKTGMLVTMIVIDNDIVLGYKNPVNIQLFQTKIKFSYFFIIMLYTGLFVSLFVCFCFCFCFLLLFFCFVFLMEKSRVLRNQQDKDVDL